MKVAATVTVTWWPERQWGRCRVEAWQSILGERLGWRDRLSMGGPLSQAMELGNSVLREQSYEIDAYVRGEIDTHDTGWQERRYRDGHRRYVRTLTYEDRFG